MPDIPVQEFIRQQAQKANVPPALALAVAEQESGFNPTVINKDSGAIGTFQLLPKTAEMLGVDPHDPVQNIQGGLKYLNQLLEQHHGDVNKVLASYGGVVHDTTYVPAVMGRLPKFADKTDATETTTSESKTSTPAVKPPAGASPSIADRLRDLPSVVPGLSFGQTTDLATGFAKKAGERVTAAGNWLRKKVPALDAGPSVSFPTTPSNPTQQLGGTLEQAAEFAVPAGVLGGAAKAAGLAGVAGAGAEALAQGATAYGVSKSQGASNTGAGINAALSAVGPFVNQALPAMATAIRNRAETVLASRFAKALDRPGPAVNYALKTGQAADTDISDLVGIVRQAARDTLEAPLRATWGKWQTLLGQDAAQKGQTLQQALQTSGIGDVMLFKEPVEKALTDLIETGTQHLAEISPGGNAKVVFDPKLFDELKAVKQQLGKYGTMISVKNLTDIKRVWDKYVYTIQTAGKVGMSADALASTAMKEAMHEGANAIRALFEEKAPTVAAINEAVSHAKRLEDLVAKLYTKQPGIGELGKWVMSTGGAGAGLAAGGMLGHPYVGLGFGSGAGRLLAKAVESPLFQTLGPKAKDTLASALASGQLDLARNLLRPFLQATVSAQTHAGATP